MATFAFRTGPGWQFTEAAVAAIGGGGLSEPQANLLMAIGVAVGAAADVAPGQPGGLATAQQVDAQLSGTHGNGPWGPAAGEGQIPVSVTCEDTAGNPLAGVLAWITSDAAGNNVVAGPLLTGAAGEVLFMLAAGTWYLWRQAAGISLAANPRAITVESGA